MDTFKKNNLLTLYPGYINLKTEYTNKKVKIYIIYDCE